MLQKLSRAIHAKHRIAAILILTLMLGLSFFTLKDDSAIIDEVAHIPAGYSYLKYGDFRLNPEHPPLIKDIAAAPLLFLQLRFPDSIPAWTQEANGQWEAGWHFLYHIGNDADQILLYSRLPILLIAIVLGWCIYRFSLRRYGPTVALFALGLYALSPNVIAHNHYVTTDIGIAAFIFFALWSFLNWAEDPSNRKKLALATVFFALAQVAKFSAVMLIPFYVVMLFIKWLSTNRKARGDLAKHFIIGLVIIFLAGLALIWLFYTPHTINTPNTVQDKLIEESLAGGYYDIYGKYLVELNNVPIIKPLVQYILGVLMVINRVQSGNITYLLGEVTNQSFAWYFPISFVLKTPLPMLIMVVGALLATAIGYFRKRTKKPLNDIRSYAQQHFPELMALMFIVFYSYLSITGNLNLGIRHLFPMMPFVFILVAKKSVDTYHRVSSPGWKKAVAASLIVLTAWYGIIAILQFPRYIPYMTEAVGGSKNAIKYLSDSNVDWGQDAKRLVEYVNNNPNIDKIAIDYFGGADMKYYFCERRFKDGKLVEDSSGYDCSQSKYIPWRVDYGKPKTKYIAVSETYLVSDIFYQQYKNRTESYQWLRDKQPVTRIGDSIYIYEVK